MQFNLDLNAAKQMGGYIDEKGAYTGVFTEAWVIKSKNGVDGVHLAFKANTGKSANNLDLYTHSADGSAIVGYNIVNQIMACLELRSMNPTLKDVEVYDYDSKKKVITQKMVFDQLLNKQIGLIIRNEQYMGKNGPKDSMKIVMPFNANSHKSAREIIEQSADAHDIIHVMADLKDKLLPVALSVPTYQSENPGYGVGGALDLDSDIPF